MDQIPQPKIDPVGPGESKKLTFDAIEILESDFERYKTLVLPMIGDGAALREAPTEEMVEKQLMLIRTLAHGGSDERVIATREAEKLHRIINNYVAASSLNAQTQQLLGSQRRKRTYVLVGLVAIALAVAAATHRSFVKAEWTALVNAANNGH